ncbi:MAG: fibronectin type III domain-containing protein [Candidatus Moraniibacteriota bacterium]
MFKQKAKINVMLAGLVFGLVLFGCSAKGVRAYANTGTYVSSVKDMHAPVHFGTISWNDVVPANTSVAVELRSGNVADPNGGGWTDWTAINKNDTIGGALDNKRYIQYRVTLNSDNLDAVPSVGDVTISAAVGTLVSSVYNTKNASNVLESLNWNETKPGTSDVLFQVRTSPDNLVWTPWCGPDNGGAGCDSTVFFTDASGGETMDGEFRTHVTPTDADRYVQYRVVLVGDLSSGATSTLSEVALHYSASQYSGTILSTVKDTGQSSSFGTLSWTDDHEAVNASNPYAGTSVAMQIRAGNTPTPDNTWTNGGGWTDVAQGGSLSAFSGNRYIQYQATLSTYDDSVVPSVSDVSLPYTYYPTTSPELLSSPYDTTDGANLLARITWSQDAPSGTAVRFQVRTAPDNNGSPDWASGSGWCAPTTCASTTADADYASGGYQTVPAGEDINPVQRTGNNDRWIQYALWLDSNDTSKTPILHDLTLNYVVNGAPEVQNVAASQDTSGTVNLTYEVKDADTATGRLPGKVDTSLEYCSDQCDSPGNETWLPASAVTGMGRVSVSGSSFTRYSATWNPVTDYSEHYPAHFKIRVKADDTELANNLGYAESPTFTLDTKKPVGSGLSVNLQDDTVTINQPQEDSGYDIFLSVGQGFPDTPTLTDAQSLTYPHTFHFADLSAIGVNGTVSLKIVDRYGNVSDAYSYIVPPTPEDVIFFDISNASQGTYTEFLTWKSIAGENLRYHVCRDETNDGEPVADPSTLSYDTCHAIADISSNFFIDNNLDGTKHYFYHVFTENTLDHSVSNFSNIVQDTPDGNGASDSTPPTLSDVTVHQDTDVTATSITVTWKANEISNSGMGFTSESDYEQSQYAKERTTYDPEMIAAGATHSYTLTGLEPGTTYYLRPRSNDVLGNQGIIGNWGPDQGNGIITVKTKDGPAIKRFTIKETTNDSVTITWSTTTVSDSAIYYSQAKSGGALTIDDANVPNASNGVIKDESHYVLVHELKVPNLKTGETYSFFLRSASENGNFAVENNAGKFYEFTTDDDTANPVISFDAGSQPFFTTNSKAGLSWSTDQPTTTTLRYKKRAESAYQDYAIDQNLLDSGHTVFLETLDSYTVYDFVIAATDINGNRATEVSGSFRTAKDPDSDHPALSSIDHISVPDGNLSDTNAVVTFNTDQAALCLAELSVSSGSYTNPIVIQEDGYDANRNYTTAHTLRFIGLIFSTPYYFRLTCHDNLQDDSGHFAYLTSDESSFTTKEKLYTAEGAGALGDHTAPSLSSIQTSNITGESATVSWNTDEAANSLVKFGLTDTTMDQMAGDALASSAVSAYTNAHQVIVSRLIPGIKYFFSVLSSDAAGNISESSVSSFTTRLLSAVSSIHTASQQIGEVTVTWKTSTPTSSFVEYGAAETYGDRKESNTLSTDHSIVLSKLTSGTEYHFRVGGTDKDKNLYTSSDSTFSAKAPPVLSAVSIGNVTERSADVSFTTDVPTDALVVYQNGAKQDDSGSQGKPELSLNHVVKLTNLTPGSSYAVTVKVRDDAGNETDDATKSFQTTADDNPPTLEQVKINTALTQDDKVQTLVTFFTDELATAAIKYREGTQGEEKSLTITQDPSTSHTAVLLTFNPGSVYYVRLLTTDLFGNTSESEDYVVLTPKRSENVVQVIVKNFNDIFSWTKM